MIKRMNLKLKMKNELLYKYQIEYINIEFDNIDLLIEDIENEKLIEIQDIKKYLDDNNNNIL